MTFLRKCAFVGLAVAFLTPGVSRAQVFSNEEQSCVQYGDWAVKEIRRAQSLGCDSNRAKERFEPSFHMNWCMRQTDKTMRNAALVHRTGVAFRCAQQGVNVTGR